MNDYHTIVAGHSHLASLGLPVKHPRTELRPLPGFPGVGGLAGQWPRPPDYWEELKTLAAGRSVVLLWQGSQHLRHFLLSPEPIDFLYSGQPDLPLTSGATIVPEQCLREIFQPTLTELVAFLGELRSAGARRLIVAGIPPPKDDDDFCREKINRERAYVKVARAHGMDDFAAVPLTAPLVRYKTWALLQDMMRASAHEAGAQFLPSPKAALTGSYGLAREFWAGDVTHANTAYGALMLRHIVEALSKEPELAPV